jgi:hypothetical protein
MRTWKAILLGVLVGLSATACYLGSALLSKSALLLALREKWPELSLVWLVAYGVAVAVCCVAHVLRTGRREWLRTYLLELVNVQYWTAAVLLLALHLWRIPLGLDAALPPILLAHPALTACVGLVLTGFIGALVAGFGLALSERHGVSYRGEDLEASLREMLALWQEQMSVAAAESSSAEKWRTSMSAALDALVRETSRLKDEVQAAVDEFRASNASGPPAQAEPADIAMLHDAMRSIEQSVPRLEQIANSLSAAVLSAGQHGLTASTGAIADLSGQLDELLRDVSETGQMPV